MRHVLTFLLILSMLVPVPSALAAGARQAASAGSLSGTAARAGGRAMANATVQLRDIATGQIAATTTSSAGGQFTFAKLPAGNYMVEVVDASGRIVGTSASILVAPGAAVIGVTVTGSAAGAAVAGLTTGSFFASTAGVVTLAAAGAAVAGVTVAATRTTASPSR
jgi:hypothetical protein